MIIKLILKRLGGAAVTLFLASIIIFLLIRLAPGDPINLVLGDGPSDIGINAEMLEERREELREEHGLNNSAPVQYINWLKNIVTLDMGTSIRSGRPILQEIGNRIPATVSLSLVALLIETTLGVLFGVHSAIRAGKFQDGIIRLFCVVLASLPAFVLSLLFLFIFAVHLNWYEISSQMEWSRLWLPAITLGLIGAPRTIRIVRATMLTELGQLYVSSSLSRGLSKKLVIQGAIQNALLPIITTIALSFAHMIGGSVVIETIFNWPGIGNYAISSILVHDYPAIQGYTVLTVASVIAINLLVEIIYLLTNPVVRRGGESRLTAK